MTTSNIFPFIFETGDITEPIRLDRFLADKLSSSAVSRSRIKMLITEGFLTINGKTLTDPSRSVRSHERYCLNFPSVKPTENLPEDIPLTILFEDEHLLIIDKPIGLVVHPAPGNETGTLVNAVLAHCGDYLTGIGGKKRPGIVHRLDKDTSGVMVIAKSEQALTTLSEDFLERRLTRYYLALVWGIPNPAVGDIEGPIGRDPLDRKRMKVWPNGKYALTHYQTLKINLEGCALIRCRLATGRTHQIRVHFSHIGHPLVGDQTYLRRIPAIAKKMSPPLKESLLNFPSQALHAETLGIRHPITRESLSFTTPLPPAFADLIKKIF